MKNIILILATIISVSAFQTNATAQGAKAKKSKQEINVWQILAMVIMEKKFDEDMGIDIEKPRFGKKVKAIHGSEITIKGYILPLKASKNQKYFILSAVPFNQCFYCGGAGPESVMEVFSTVPVKSSKKMVKLKGKLIVNFNPSLGQVLYTLKDAKVVKD